jgi:hypothetical protein
MNTRQAPGVSTKNNSVEIHKLGLGSTAVRQVAKHHDASAEKHHRAAREGVFLGYHEGLNASRICLTIASRRNL